MCPGNVARVRFLLLGGWLLAAAASGWCANHEAKTVVLRGAVEISHTPVLLSDLLPSGVVPGLFKASATIELCSAPQPGSVRILHAEDIGQRIAGQENLRSALAIPPEVAIHYSGWPVPADTITETVMSFLRTKTWGHDLAENPKLEWAEPLVSRQEHFLLQVTGTEWDYRRQVLQVQIRCSDRAACGSFLVRLILPESASKHLRGQPDLASLAMSPHPETATPSADGPILAIRGKSATLVLNDGKTRITIPVICMDPGRLHEHIRVLDRQSRRVSRAEVVGAGLVHATL